MSKVSFWPEEGLTLPLRTDITQSPSVTLTSSGTAGPRFQTPTAPSMQVSHFFLLYFCTIMLKTKLLFFDMKNCSSMLLNFVDYRKTKTEMRAYMVSTKCP